MDPMSDLLRITDLLYEGLNPVHRIDALTVSSVTRARCTTAAVYRVGSRADGTWRHDSDFDYLILLNENTHYHSANARGDLLPGGWWRHEIYFTRKDLEDPGGMEGREMKLMFLHGKHRGRILLWGSDVFDKWLSPRIDEIFAADGIDEDSVRERMDALKVLGSADIF